MKKKLILIILALLFIWFMTFLFGYRVDFRKMFFNFAQMKGVPLVPIEKQLRLYQTNTFDYKPRDLIRESAVFQYRPNEKQRFYLGIKNCKEDNTDFINPVLTIRFMDPGDIEVYIDEKLSKGWTPSDPSGTYFYRSEENLQPTKLSISNRNPLFVIFKKEKYYKVNYEIAGQNEMPISGAFYIKVGNPKESLEKSSRLYLAPNESKASILSPDDSMIASHPTATVESK